MEKMIRVLMLEPGKKAREEFIENNLEALQAAVGGMIETYYPYDDCVLVVNEEGKINGMEPNRGVYEEKTGDLLDIIFGPFFICGDGEELCSLTDEQLHKYYELFEFPEKMIAYAGRIVCEKYVPAE